MRDWERHRDRGGEGGSGREGGRMGEREAMIDTKTRKMIRGI